MLATIPRAAPRAARRALTTGAAQRAPLAPPYEHSNRSSLAPPYAQHVAAASEAADSLQAPYAFQVVQQRPVAPVAPTPAEWVAGVLETEAGRQWAQTAWESALNDLAEQVGRLLFNADSSQHPRPRSLSRLSPLSLPTRPWSSFSSAPVA